MSPWQEYTDTSKVKRLVEWKSYTLRLNNIRNWIFEQNNQLHTISESREGGSMRVTEKGEKKKENLESYIEELDVQI